jgi:Subtilisin inhibitor-like
MTACGTLGGTSDSGSTTVTTVSSTELTIVVWPQGVGGPSRTWTLTCDPVGGSLSAARSACSRVTRQALRPLPRDSICTQVYGGPQKARVTGQIDGRAVDARFSRTNGCEIHRWNGVRYLFPVRI